MSQLFSNAAGEQLLGSLRKIFQNKRIYYRKDRFIMFVCGGRFDEAAVSLRKGFIEWASRNLPQFVCLMAEDALKDSFAGEGRKFVNLSNFESILADVADCVVIFPESPGSFAEVGFFANSKISEKTLVVNPLLLQAVESFLNLGPIDTIGSVSFLKPTILIDAQGVPDFTPIGQRLRERVKWPEHRERLPYQTFGQFNFKQKLLVVFEVLRLLRLADLATLRQVLQACFNGNPRYQELKHLLMILLAAKFIRRDAESEYFTTIPGVHLIEIEHLEVEKISAQVLFFYQRYSKELYDALPAAGVGP
jgi:hypothetical protein